MTVRRASFLGLASIVFAVWTIAIGCNLDATGYGESEDVCTLAAHCDDDNVCTDDVCGADGVCVHTAVPDGLFPDGATGNCKVFECLAGDQKEAAYPDDKDDGNECTQDACDANGNATHQIVNGGPCHLLGANGVCDSKGECVVECGQTDADGGEVGCPSSDDDCTVSYCDKAKGVCVLDLLDGVAYPNTTPGQCGGSYCIQGKKTDVFADLGTACSGLTGMGNEAIVCDGAGTCVGCNTADDCNPDGTPMSFCFSASCVMTECVVNEAPDGTVLPAGQQTAADCLEKRCFGKVVTEFPFDTDLPTDGNKCTFDTCVNGVPTFPPTPLNTACGINDDLFCDGAGSCLGCTMATQCGNATDCHQYACNNGTCGDIFPPNDTPLPVGKQTTGDCLLQVCDGAGNQKPKADDGDLPNDNNDCTLNQCAGGSKVFPAVSAGSTCNANRVCDGGGNCLGGACVGVADCPMGAFCVDGVCCNAACDATCAACTIALKNSGLNGDCGVSASGTDNNDTDCPGTKVCNGTLGAGACKQILGQGCSIGSECLSANCADMVCCNTACNGTCQVCNAAGTQGTCTPIPAGTDPANECAGAVNCNGGNACGNLFGNGVACSTPSECQSNNCVDGVCCNTACGALCQACNLGAATGTCTPIAAEQDPGNECNGASSVCNGAGACKVPLGGTCAAPGDCASGFCADGVCCNNACGGLCKACNLAATMGTCTNLANGQDPASECAGATSCNGSGACALFGNGTACTLNGECTSGNCVDGVCCNNACGGLCQACNLGASMGSCTSLPNGQDPINECVGARVCNGSGACTGGPIGAACGGNSECASGNCVDGVCCNNACGGTCQACNLGGSIGTCTSIPNGQDPANECAGMASCSGAASCALFANGTACAVNGECSSGNCIDGVCCNTSCATACQACDVSGSVGTCTNVPANTDPHNDCAGAIECNGAGACEAANGAACSTGSQCQSGSCVDGVCCGSASCATCQTCNGGTPGTCTNIASGGTDNFPVGTCTGNNTCDGNSGAAACKKNDGQLCPSGMNSECFHGNCVDGYCCNTGCGMACQACNLAGSQGTCSNLPADTDPGDMECPGAQVCGMMGTCVDGGLGATCPMNGAEPDCVNGFCADGVCCDVACSGDCQACTSAKKGSGSNGTCGPVASGTDPDNECPNAGPSACSGNECQ